MLFDAKTFNAILASHGPSLPMFLSTANIFCAFEVLNNGKSAEISLGKLIPLTSQVMPDAVLPATVRPSKSVEAIIVALEWNEAVSIMHMTTIFDKFTFIMYSLVLIIPSKGSSEDPK
jgi:hypothetical protein